MDINLHFTEHDWQRIERDWTAWWAGELERPMVMIEGLEPLRGATLPDAPDFTSNLPLEMSADKVIDRYQALLEAKRFYGDAWPKWWPNFGPGIMAGFLGAQVRCAPDTVWFEAEEPAEARHIQDLHPAYDAGNLWWRRIQELTRVAVERWGNQASVSITDLGGNLDILASLRTTEQLLLDLYDAPDEVARLTSEITRLWLRYYDELYAVVQKAGRTQRQVVGRHRGEGQAQQMGHVTRAGCAERGLRSWSLFKKLG